MKIRQCKQIEAIKPNIDYFNSSLSFDYNMIRGLILPQVRRKIEIEVAEMDLYICIPRY